MNKKMVYFVLAAFLLSLVLLAGCGQQQKQAASTNTGKKVVKIGSETTFPPFEFQDEKTKDYVGFDIDLAKAVFTKAGYEPEIVSTQFDGLIPALDAGVIDAIVSGMQITEERSKKVLFSNPYYESGQNILVRADNTAIKNWNDLEGKKIGVQIGTTGAAEAKKVPNADIREFNNTSEANLELKAGGVDAVVNSVPVNAYYLKNGGGAKDAKIVGDIHRALYCGIAVKKGNTEMVEKINKALEEIKQSGEYDKICEKWFGKKQ
ncbi:Glutamine-binding periplasmic protein [Sporomusa rhizae]|uniref:basic amino acid ABC transporter substrate-binding protein n=1 Tax=Sporomusa rhizae TaxID=357999 RepID=UPI00352AA928